MNWFVIRVHACLFECLTEGWVSMACARNIFRTRAVFHPQYSLSNHFSSIGTNDMCSKDAVGLLVSQDLHKSFTITIGTSARICRKGERPLRISHTCLLQFFLRLTNRRNFWVSINHPRNSIIIDMPSEASNCFDRRNAFLFRLVRKHGAINTITDGIDRWNSCLEVLINLDSPELISLYSQGLKSKSISVRPPASGNKNNVVFFCFLLSTFGSFCRKCDPIVSSNTTHHLCFQLKFKSLLLQCGLKFFGEFLVHCRTETVHKLNHFAH
mmetsp:Transcript_41496/g.125724  ORF Transcript_41496/g.125724 Transcript_41496/m.125724 type:complete len:269 (+) Transcript_41496:412-1218(+)